VLQLADGSGEWYYPKGTISENMIENLQYRLPAGVTCARCVLQVRRCVGLHHLTCQRCTSGLFVITQRVSETGVRVELRDIYLSRYQPLGVSCC